MVISQTMHKIRVNIYTDADGHPFYFTYKQVEEVLRKMVSVLPC